MARTSRDMTDVAVEVRGIYSTALTRILLDAGHRVVRPSGILEERFDDDFGDEEPTVRVRDSRDRHGVEVSGEDGVEAVAETLASVALDAAALEGSLKEGGIYDGVVEDIFGGGALVDVGPGAAFLPFSEADRYVETGDRLRVQVRNPESPWVDRRPTCSAAVRVSSGDLELSRGGEWSEEAHRLVEMTSAEVPTGWAIPGRVGVQCFEEELPECVDRAHRLEELMEEAGEPGEPGPVAEPLDTRWVRLGREAKFALDRARREVTVTMTGHHRLKSVGDGAGSAVDFFEATVGDTGELPFAGAAAAFGPRIGDRVALHHGKPDGSRINLGKAEVRSVDPEEGKLVVQRSMSPGGTYDGLGAPKEEGDVAVTTLREGEWSYRTDYHDAEGALKGTYVNVCTPVEIHPRSVDYVDLYVDVVQLPGEPVEVIDLGELRDAESRGLVSPELAEKARGVADRERERLGEG